MTHPALLVMLLGLLLGPAASAPMTDRGGAAPADAEALDVRESVFRYPLRHNASGNTSTLERDGDGWAVTGDEMRWDLLIGRRDSCPHLGSLLRRDAAWQLATGVVAGSHAATRRRNRPACGHGPCRTSRPGS